MTLSKKFAQNIWKLRTDKRWSQNQLALKLKLSVSYVSMLERATRSPTLATLGKFSKVFKVPPTALLS